METQKINLENLKAKIPYQWRVQSFSKFKPACSCVAYIDARQVMDLLDSVCGAENWQSDYKEVKGNMFAGIGININGNWVWKWDCGTESQTEKEKGEASDSFKRAAVKWGVGRFLYEMEIKYLKANAIKGDSDTATHKRYPQPVDDSGKIIYNISEFINGI